MGCSAIVGRTSQLSSTFQAGYLDALDGRTAIAAGMRARWQQLTDDMGGADALPYAQRSLVERALWLEHWLHTQELALGKGEVDRFDAGRWTKATNSLLGILTRLGLERRAKDVTPLPGYTASKASAHG